MSYKDLLFVAVTYPDATPESAIVAGAFVARRLGGEVTGLALAVDLPLLHNRLANALIGLDSMAVQEEARSARQARTSARSLTAAAAKAGLQITTIVERAPVYQEGERARDHARTRDLCMMAIGPTVAASRSMAEAVLFGSGRPILIFPEEASIGDEDRFGTVAVAWDGGRAAARAAADALPILQQARRVRILVVTDEKPGVGAEGARDLVRHLARHGVKAAVDLVPAGSEPIGQSLAAYVGARKVDLLVMGGFGHARMREFILGGATRSILERPPCPALLSH